jgi:N-acetylglucosaminyl-diphospho-decaprenol L-rhamnosyltransferase
MQRLVRSVDVAIVNYNTAASALTAAAAYLRSEGAQARVTIIDNASLPAQRALLSEGAPESVALSLQDANLGYGTAANRALAGGSGEFVCVSNSDLAPASDMLEVLTEVAAREPDAGLVAPRFEGGKPHYHVKLPRAWQLPLWTFALYSKPVTVPDPPAGVVIDVEQPAGACLVARRSVWEQLGGFDEGFFLWFEDVDLACRSLKAGYRNRVVGSAIARHVGGEAFVSMTGGQRIRIWNRSLVRYTAKHHPAVAWITRICAFVAVPLYTLADRMYQRLRGR